MVLHTSPNRILITFRSQTASQYIGGELGSIVKPKDSNLTVGAHYELRLLSLPMKIR